jgi:DNA invertase Pin-like site-specific DNA recombinase
MKTECIIYCRVSSEGQTAGHGLTRQLETCLAFAKARDYSVVAVFSEVASGVDPLPARGQVERMAARRHCKIICENYDRWSRKGACDAPPSNVEMASETAQILDEELHQIFSRPNIA